MQLLHRHLAEHDPPLFMLHPFPFSAYSSLSGAFHLFLPLLLPCVTVNLNNWRDQLYFCLQIIETPAKSGQRGKKTVVSIC